MPNFSSPGVFDANALYGLAVGAFAYLFLRVWVALSARWVNWFPLLAKTTRLALYGTAAGGLITTLSVLQQVQALGLFAAAACVGFLGLPALRRVIRIFRPQERTKRGSVVQAARDVNAAAAKELPARDFKDCLTLGGVRIPRPVEPLHFFVIGATGTGKSVAITQVLDAIEARGEVALVVDSGGEFASRYYQEGRDAILNPFDSRCVAWSPTAELEGPWDAEALAKSMVPDGHGDSKEWNNYAQTLITSVLRQLQAAGDLSLERLLYFVQAASIEELAPLLAGTAAAAQLTNDRTLGSIRTIASNYLATYAYLGKQGEPFSIARFVRGQRPGFLFLTYRDDQLDSLRNLIACALDVASRTVLSLPPNSARRVWLVIDEAASIGAVQSIEAFATKARKCGGCLLLGLQSVSQLKARYGDNDAQTILSCLSSWLVLRSADPESAEFISRYIGEAEVSRMTRGESSSLQGATDSLNEQIQLKRLVLPSELQELPKLSGFFRLAGGYPIARVALGFPQKREARAQTFAARDFRAVPMVSLSAQNVSSQASSGAAGVMGGLAPDGPAPQVAEAAPSGNVQTVGRTIDLAAPDLDWAAMGLALEEAPAEEPLVGGPEDSPQGLEGVLLELATS